MKNRFITTTRLISFIAASCFISLCFPLTILAQEKKHVVDAIVDTEYNAPITPLMIKHESNVVIDRIHNTIYRLPKDEQGTHAMRDILQRDGYTVTFLDEYTSGSLANADVLVIHGLPNDKVQLDGELFYWKSPLTPQVIHQIVRWVANGGGLFLTLSHHPNGSGAKPLLEAFDVKFRDGYLFSQTFPSFLSSDDRCSHFFGMADKLIKQSHPLLSMGEEVKKIDFHCGAAVFRHPEDVILAFPADAGNYDNQNKLLESSANYAGLIGFPFGKGKVVIATDQGMFRNFVFTFNTGEKVHVTITSRSNDNAKLFTNLMRWLSPKIH